MVEVLLGLGGNLGDPIATIEAAAEAVATALLNGFPLIERVVVEVRKPAAAIDAVFEHVGVVIERARRG